MDLETKEFYDGYWPRNVPVFAETEKYVLATVTERGVATALDAGCGHGLCGVALARIARRVVAVDVSSDSLATAREQAARHGAANIEFIHEDLQELSQPDEAFDLVWCWGVAMMAPDPMGVIGHLMRVTKPGGTLYLALYLKTWLSPVHQGLRHFCRAFLDGPRRRRLVCDFFAALTRVMCFLRGEEINERPDNETIQAQVEDWFYPPFKTFYSIEEIVALLEANGFAAECIQDRLSRIKSATNFVVRGVKRTDPSRI